MNLIKSCSDIPMVSQRGGRLFTTSLDVAEKFGKKHKNVIQSILNLDCSAEFSRLNFQPRNYIDDRGKVQPMFNMTKDGFTFLAMGFRGKEAASWKEKYIAAFNAMESALTRQANLLWQEQRRQGKAVRREVTDTIQTFVAYAEGQGSRNSRHYYRNITTATCKALFLVQCNTGHSFRDLLDSMQLNFLSTAEFVAARAIEDGMEQGLFYKEIYKLAKERVERFANVVPKTKVLGCEGVDQIEAGLDQKNTVTA
ncbi:Rha family transcriptional regulator [Desulfobulbus sp.]|uniref:Rha family transcriptional regulator n=1 Tax=Desulfobulbus sp. TaxID=895 RepID=UPI00286F4CB1|nr:Rha family transcriptional regulator [Desulfobulbus sp.]